MLVSGRPIDLNVKRKGGSKGRFQPVLSGRRGGGERNGPLRPRPAAGDAAAPRAPAEPLPPSDTGVVGVAGDRAPAPAPNAQVGESYARTGKTYR